MKPDRVEKYYAAHEWQPALPGNDPAWHVWVERTRLVRLTAVFRASPPPADVLELGCGTGDILVTLREHGYRVRGIELDSVPARHAAEVLGAGAVSMQPIERETASGFYDAVLLFSVLEHAARPLEFMRHVNRVLKPGGKVVIHVPNLAFFMLRQRLGLSVNWRLPGHLHHFSFRALGELLRRSGFRIRGQFWHEYPFVPPGRGFLTRARVALTTGCYRLAWEGSLRRLNLGSTINVVAEKCGEARAPAAGEPSGASVESGR